MMFYSGSVQQYLKTVQLKTEWSVKQQEAKKSPLLEELEKARKESKMSAITNLLRMGKRLTPEEKAYLRQHAPDLYHQAVSVEAERDAYKKALQSCRTKEAADRLHRAINYRFAAEISHISKSNMPADSKQKAVNFIEYRFAACGEAYREFTSEGRYSRLPSEFDLKLKSQKEKISFPHTVDRKYRGTTNDSPKKHTSESGRNAFPAPLL